MALTEKQRRFVEEYLIDLNATQAAIRSGYSERTANEQGARLLANVSVQEAVRAAQKARSERTGITADRVLSELADMALYDPADLCKVRVDGPDDIPKLTEAVRRCIIGWGWDRNGKFTLKLSPKTPSLELLGRHLGMFKDRLELSGTVGLADRLAAARKRAADDGE